VIVCLRCCLGCCRPGARDARSRGRAPTSYCARISIARLSYEAASKVPDQGLLHLLRNLGPDACASGLAILQAHTSWRRTGISRRPLLDLKAEGRRFNPPPPHHL
jgi:hypothetical protein